MCGIVGYTGPREAGPILIEGLKRLEYRGYDSAGIALVDDAGDLFVEKRAGKLVNLQTAIADRTPHAAIGLAHTRWATHGRPNDLNAHPHRDCTGEITVIHNGIIENFRELRDGLEARGHTLTSETDTEAIAHLVEEAYQGDLADAVRDALRKLDGAYAIVVMHIGEGDRLIGARKDVPLVVGLGDGESFLASDVAAILAHTDQIVFLEDGDVADLRPWGVTITDVDGAPLERPVTTIDWSPEAAEKGGYEHFMLKEIHEQPESLSQSIAGRVDRDDRINVEELAGLEEIAADGHAGRADRLRQRPLRLAHRGGGDPGLDRAAGPRERRLRVPLRTAAARRADAGHRRHPVGRDRRHDRPDPPRPRARLPGHRGHEHGRLGHHPRGRRGPLPAGRPRDRGRRLEDVRHPGHDAGHPGRRDRQDPRHAPRSRRAGARCRAAGAAGRRGPGARGGRDHDARTWPAATSTRAASCSSAAATTYPAALEGALKLKEVSYVHAEGYAAGELKHGPISLLDAECPLVAVATRSPVYDKLISNVMEGRARDARVIAVATEGDEAIEHYADDVCWVPDTHEALSPVLAIIPLQLFAYHIAVARGTDVDQPRNLAKSVTVE